MSTHGPECECDTYGCQLRRKGVQVAVAAMPSRHNRRAPRKSVPPAYNKQVMGEHRQGGGFMPYIKPDGEPWRQKEYVQKRRELTTIRQAQIAQQTSGTSNG